MHRLWRPTGLALIMFALPWSVATGAAQQPAKDLVPFKASWTGQNQAMVVATDPTLVSQPTTLNGQSDLFGPFTGVSLATLHRGVDEKPLYATVVGEWSMANGDALSIEVIDLFVPQTTAGAPLFEAVLVITNGKGRFLGARGSGFLTGTLQVDPVTRQGTVIISAEGLVTRPKS